MIIILAFSKWKLFCHPDRKTLVWFNIRQWQKMAMCLHMMKKQKNTTTKKPKTEYLFTAWHLIHCTSCDLYFVLHLALPDGKLILVASSGLWLQLDTLTLCARYCMQGHHLSAASSCSAEPLGIGSMDFRQGKNTTTDFTNKIHFICHWYTKLQQQLLIFNVILSLTLLRRCSMIQF